MTDKKLHISKADFVRYLENKMTSTERNTFEKELQKHPFEAEALEGFEAISAENIQIDLNEIKAKLKPKRRNNFRYWAAAASVLLVVSAGVIWMEVKDKNRVSEMAETKNIEKQEKVQGKSDRIIEPARLNNAIEETTYSEEIPQIENESETLVIAEKVIVKDEPRQKSARKESKTIKQVEQPTEQKKAAVRGVAPDAEKTKNISFARTERKAKNQLETEEYQVLDDAPVGAVVAAPIAAPPAVKEMADSKAVPNGGFDIFNTYLDSAALLPENYKKKKVVVKIEFKIDSQGVISDFANKNNADSLLFEKAKEIILNGPKWSPKIKDGERLDSTVKLKIVFRK